MLFKTILLVVFATYAMAMPVSSLRNSVNSLIARTDALNEVITRTLENVAKDIIIRTPHLGDDDIIIRSEVVPEVNIRGGLAVASRDTEIALK